MTYYFIFNDTHVLKEGPMEDLRALTVDNLEAARFMKKHFEEEGHSVKIMQEVL
jgi:hypothetical protein